MILGCCKKRCERKIQAFQIANKQLNDGKIINLQKGKYNDKKDGRIFVINWNQVPHTVICQSLEE